MLLERARQQRRLVGAFSCISSLIVAGCGSGGGARDVAERYAEALSAGEADAVCELSTPRGREALADLNKAFRLTAGESVVDRVECEDNDAGSPSDYLGKLRVSEITEDGDTATAELDSSKDQDDQVAIHLVNDGGDWRVDSGEGLDPSVVFLDAPASCVSSWMSYSNGSSRDLVAQGTGGETAGFLSGRESGGCSLSVETGDYLASFETNDSSSAGNWVAHTVAADSDGSGTGYNVRVYDDGGIQPLADVLAGLDRPEDTPDPRD